MNTIQTQKNNSKLKTVQFITLGCKTNQYETDGMAERMQAAGYDIMTDGTGADITVVNTCAVTNIAERKSRQMMRKAKKANPNTILIAAGCYIQNVEETLDELSEVDIFLGNNQKQYIVDYVKEYEENQEKQTRVIDVNHTSEYEEFSIGATGATKEHTRAYIKIQDGCNQFCSYCIIPYVRGRVRSRSVDEIVNEAVRLAKDGYQEIVLTGIHISSYGVDFDNGTDMAKLLTSLHEIEGIARIRLGSLEPRIITEEFVKLISGMPKICPHFHLSLQSGCDATLKRMNRKYSANEYHVACDWLRKYYSQPAITTDVIVGFPGETDEEFQETYEFLKELQLYETHIFKYSIRKGTNAEKLPNQVDGNVKNQRSDSLLVLHEENKRTFEQKMVGQKALVLLEEEKNLTNDKDGTLHMDNGTDVFGDNYMVGHTMNYVKVAILVSELETILSSEMSKEEQKNDEKDVSTFVGKIVEVTLENDRVDDYMIAHFS